MLVFNGTSLGNVDRLAPPANWVSLGLQPTTNDDCKRMLYDHVRSQIIAQGIFGRFDQASINKLTTMKKLFTWIGSSGGSFDDGAMMACLTVLECSPETKVGVQVLRSNIDGAKSLTLSNNVPVMLDHVESAMGTILEMGEAHGNLLKGDFDALLTALNTAYHQHFELEKMSWQGGTKVRTHD